MYIHALKSTYFLLYKIVKVCIQSHFLKVSVRSSAVGEDSADLSAAGQLDTILGVHNFNKVINTKYTLNSNKIHCQGEPLHIVLRLSLL